MSGKSFVVNNNAAAAITFNPTVAITGGQQYIDSSSNMLAPRIAQVKHTIPPISSNKSADRHFVQFSKTMYDATGVAYVASVGVSVVIPRQVVTNSEVADLRKFGANFINTDTIWNGFVVGDY